MRLGGQGFGLDRAHSVRQLPTDHDYAVSTRGYQSDQPSRQRPLDHHGCCMATPSARAHGQESLATNTLS